MIDRKKLVEGLEYCIKAMDKNCPMACPFFQECFSVFKSTEPFYPIMRAALDFLKEEELKEDRTDWIHHVYRCGNKEYECSWCHWTSGTNSDYCPNCGTRMDRTVDMDD